MRRALLVLCCAAVLRQHRPRPPPPRPSRPPTGRRSTPPCVDPFRPPATPYGAGNRGLEYGTDAGHAGRAPSADGRVTFAGPVGRHAARHRAARRRRPHHLLVPASASTWWSASACAQGDQVGVTGGHLHLGARRGDAYLDPAVAVRRRRAAGAPRALRRAARRRASAGERSAIGQLIGGAGDLLDGVGRRRRRRRRLAARRRHASCCAPSTTTASRFTLPGARSSTAGSPIYQALAAGPVGRRPAVHRGRRRRPAAAGAAGRGARRRPRLAQRRLHRRPGAHRRARVRAPPTCSGSATPAGGCPTPPTGSRRSRPPTTAPPRPRPTSGRTGRRLADLVEQVAAAVAGRADRPDRPLAGRGGGPAGADRARAPPRRGVARAGRAGRHARHAARRRRPGHRRPRLVQHRAPAARCSTSSARPPTRSSTTTPPSIAPARRDLRRRSPSWPTTRCPDVDRRRVDRRPRRRGRAGAAQPGARDGRGGRAAHGHERPQRPARQRRGHPGAGPGPGRPPAGVPELPATPCSTRAWGRGSASSRTWSGAGGFLLAARADVRGGVSAPDSIARRPGDRLADPTTHQAPGPSRGRPPGRQARRRLAPGRHSEPTGRSPSWPSSP